MARFEVTCFRHHRTNIAPVVRTLDGPGVTDVVAAAIVSHLSLDGADLPSVAAAVTTVSSGFGCTTARTVGSGEVTVGSSHDGYYACLGRYDKDETVWVVAVPEAPVVREDGDDDDDDEGVTDGPFEDSVMSVILTFTVGDELRCDDGRDVHDSLRGMLSDYRQSLESWPDGLPRYEKASYRNFVANAKCFLENAINALPDHLSDCDVDGITLDHYGGRNFYHGPALFNVPPEMLGWVTAHFPLGVQVDSLGRNYVVYSR